MNKLAIVGLLLICIPIAAFTIAFICCSIVAFIHDIRHHGWKYALKESSGIFITISICIGFVLLALSQCIE